MNLTYSFTGELWLYPGNGAWYFITLPKEYAKEIGAVAAQHKRGFGSVKVEVVIGTERWRTSIFPDTKSASYLLPVKKAVRTKNHLDAGDKAKVVLTVVDA